MPIRTQNVDHADLADLLPDAPRRRFLALVDKCDEVNAAGQRYRARRDERQEETWRLEQNLRRLAQPFGHPDLADFRNELRSPPTDGGPDPLDRVREGRAAVELARNRQAEVQEKYNSSSALFQVYRGLLSACERWIGAQSGPIEEAAPIEAKIPKGDLFAMVELSRAKRRDLEAELHATHTAPIPSSVAIARATAEIDALAVRGRPNCFGLIESGQPIGWPSNHQAIAAGEHIVGITVPDALAVLAWSHRDALVAKMTAEIRQRADDKNALSDQQRAAAIADLDARILEAERIEGALVEASAGAIAPRSDMDPRAYLSVDGEPPTER